MRRIWTAWVFGIVLCAFSAGWAEEPAVDLSEPPPLAVAPFSAEQARRHQEAWSKHLGKPGDVTNSIGMKFKLVPPGEFMMGSPESEHERDSDEGPQHRVRITRPFYLGVYEVTQGEYERVMGKNPSWCSAQGGGKERASGQATSRFPVEQVSWEEAAEFCRKLSVTTEEKGAGRRYCLPTEAEWEYACRAGTTTPFHFGSVLNGRQANCNGGHPYGTEQKGPYLERPTKVGSYGANGFGLHDMHGNVWEWCADWYDSGYYANSPQEDPSGPASTSYRVYRGGGWFNRAWLCRSAFRLRFGPEHRSYLMGFRVVLVASERAGN